MFSITLSALGALVNGALAVRKALQNTDALGAEAKLASHVRENAAVEGDVYYTHIASQGREPVVATVELTQLELQMLLLDPRSSDIVRRAYAAQAVRKMAKMPEFAVTMLAEKK